MLERFSRSESTEVVATRNGRVIFKICVNVFVIEIAKIRQDSFNILEIESLDYCQ